MCNKTWIAHSRREFLEKSALGFGGLAASWLLAQDRAAAAPASSFAPRQPYFNAKGKAVIYLFMHGGPSHLDTFDPKPALAALDGKPVPPSFGKVDFQFTKMDKVPIMASRQVFKKRGQSELEIAGLFEKVAACR